MSLNPRGISRRNFLADTGMGFTGLALGSMLFEDGVARAEESQPDGKPHHAPKAKSVIWIFSSGGVSHIHSFDPKPEMDKHAGKTVGATPFKDVIPAKYHKKPIGAMQVGSKRYGKSGLEVADWWPHIGGCADDIAVVRSLWVDDDNHGAQLTWHNGHHIREGGIHPTIGSWIHYGLGTLNKNLPQFVVIGGGISECCGGVWAHGAGYLGQEYAGVRINRTGIPHLRPSSVRTDKEQNLETDLLGKLDKLTAVQYPDDPALRARIKSYELAFAMQTSVPESLQLDKESEATRKLYGIDDAKTRDAGSLCLMARRYAERGVRFIQVHLQLGWDAHAGVVGNHDKNAIACDKPIAGLLADLKQRGLLNDTLVVWGTEFGRHGVKGGDHWADAFSCWLAGGGIKGGTVHGASDPLGFSIASNPHYVTDVHATVLHQLGLDSHRLEIPGRKRLEKDFGNPIREILG